MKTFNCFTTILLCAGIFLSSCKKDPALLPTDNEIFGNLIKPDLIDEYIYPILPGTPEWAQLENHEEMDEAVELPDSIINKISTWGLAETCYNYPLYGDVWAHNKPITFFNYLAQSFNGLKELYSREDATLVLLYNYRFLEIETSSDSFKLNFIQLIIGCDAFLTKLNDRQIKYLLSVALDKCKMQRDSLDSSFPPYSYFIIANLMIHSNYRPFIDYCALEKDVVTSEFMFWGINSSCVMIEEYGKDFLYN